MKTVSMGLPAAPSGDASRWETQRGNYLMGQETSGRPTSRRRRAELLQRQGRRIEARASGAAPSGAAEVVTGPLLRRKWRAAGEGNSGFKVKLFKYVVLALVIALMVHVSWIAVPVGAAVYHLLVLPYSPLLGKRVHSAVMPALLLVSAVAFAVLIVLGIFPLSPFELPGALLEHAPLAMYGPMTTAWLYGSFAAAPAVAAYLIHAWGWAAAPTVAKSARNADGSFREVKEHEKTTLRTYRRKPEPEQAPAERPAPPAPPAPAVVLPPEVVLPPAYTTPEPAPRAEAPEVEDFDPDSLFDFDDDEGGVDGADDGGRDVVVEQAGEDR